MKYMGSKRRIAKYILPIILNDRHDGQWYVEPFCGGCNSLDKVDGNRIGADINVFLIEMWKALLEGWIPPKNIARETYTNIKLNKLSYKPCLVGWVGINCSYSGKWFGGYAGKVKIKNGSIRDYQDESYRNTMFQISKLKDVLFETKKYQQLDIPDNSIIYCDPPYEDTTKYRDSFDHKSFWEWVRKISQNGHHVFCSEYNAPDDFSCIWSQEIKSSLSANGRGGGSKKSVEKLFVYNPT